jgi:hypothetical protein
MTEGHTQAQFAQLVEELERLRTIMAAHAPEARTRGEAVEIPSSTWDPHHPSSTPLDHLCELFELDAFERDLLLTCAGCELDAPFAAMCRSVAVDPSLPRPTVSLALACLPGASWHALGPGAALRYWELLRASETTALSQVQLTVDEAVLHYLLEGEFWDPELDGLIEPLMSQPSALASSRESAAHIIGVWTQASTDQLPLIQVLSPDPGAGLELAATLCAELDAPGFRIDGGSLPTNPIELSKKLRRWQRCARIHGAIGVLDAASQAPDQTLAGDALARWCESADGPLLLLTRARRVPGARTWVTIELDRPKSDEQRQVWGRELDAHFPELESPLELVDRLVTTFDLSATRIRSACASARGRLDTSGDTTATPDALLWHACRIQARPDLDAFAQRLDGRSSWADLRVRPETLAILRSICDQVRSRATVHERWGVGTKSRRGQGISVLFSGPSGTGKTMTAEVIGTELELDVYRVDLSAVVSKYIGETEKNLARVFDAAEGSGVILLFDEADALFGKRSEVKDSHDRHANVEIGYLLQRMEAYRGLAILTTNLREDIDQAFLRRLRFIVEFGHPSVEERVELWRLALGQGAPVVDFDLHALARLALTGGQIRNVVMNAAFAAAVRGGPIDAELLREAICQEYQKHGQLLSNADLERLAPRVVEVVGGGG